MAALGAFYTVKLFLLTMLIAFRCQSVRHIRFYLFAIVAGASFLIIPTVLSANILSYDERLAGSIGQANAAGTIAASTYVACLCLLVLFKNKIKYVLFPILALICIRTILLTSSRGSFVVVAGCSVYFLIYVWRHSVVKGKVGIVLFMIVAAIGMVKIMVGSALFSRLASLPGALGFNVGVQTGEAAETGRIVIIGMVFDVWKTHPFLGVGWATFQMYSPFVYTHTTPLEFLYGAGAVGTFLYYAIVLSIWILLSKVKKHGALYSYASDAVFVCRLILIMQLLAGISLPTQYSKVYAAFMGIWLGGGWCFRTYMLSDNDDTGQSEV